MKKTLLIFALAIPILCFATNALNRYDIVVGTKSVAISSKTTYTRFPLNQIVLFEAADSINVQFFTTTGFGNTNRWSPVTQLDSFSHYTHNGTKFTSVSQIDSFYQAKFVQ